MMMNKKGQSIGEYVMVIGIVAAALLTMQVYIKRGIQSVIKASADELKMSEDGAGQFEGIQEIGLADYKQIVPLTITTEKNITLVESDSSRKTTINTDETKTKGEWQVSYSLEKSEIFRASEMTKKPPKTKETSPETTN